jgi:hypothetical protein
MIVANKILGSKTEIGQAVPEANFDCFGDMEAQRPDVEPAIGDVLRATKVVIPQVLRPGPEGMQADVLSGGRPGPVEPARGPVDVWAKGGVPVRDPKANLAQHD